MSRTGVGKKSQFEVSSVGPVERMLFPTGGAEVCLFSVSEGGFARNASRDLDN